MLPDTFYRSTTQRALGAGVLFVGFCILSILVQTVPKGRDDDLMYLSSPTSTATSSEKNWANGNLLDSGSISFMLISTGLVLFMTPGLAFFYGGMVRQKNMISTLLNSYAMMGIIMVLWVIIGYSLAFGKNAWGGVIGSPKTHYFFKGVGAQPAFDVGYSDIPESLYAMYQATFAIITPAIITGSVVERAHFNAMCLFCGIWHLLVYCPLAHMEWSPDGLIHLFGHKDFAGGTVVHMSSGVSAFVLARLLGERTDDATEKKHHTPAHVPYVLLGTALLWFGWIGFNAGSAVSAGVSACQALVTTITCASSCLVAWILWDYMLGRKVTAVGACCGAVVGLVVITPACGFVTVGASMIMGIIGAVVCNVAVGYLKKNSRTDDTLDVFGCHGVGGITGMILTSCFASPHVSPDPENLYGLFYGYGKLFWHTLVVGILVCIGCSVGTIIIYHFVNLITPFRVSAEEEAAGLDSSLHGEMITMTFGGEDKAMDGSHNGTWDKQPVKGPESVV